MVNYFERRRLAWFTLVDLLKVNASTRHLLKCFERDYRAPEESEFIISVDMDDTASTTMSLAPDSPLGVRATGPARGTSIRRGQSHDVALARARFASRVAALVDGVDRWRQDPAALWRVIEAKYGIRHAERIAQRVDDYLEGIPPVAGEKVLQYLEQVESETEALNRECRQANSSNCQGEQSMIRTIRKGLSHITGLCSSLQAAGP